MAATVKYRITGVICSDQIFGNHFLNQYVAETLEVGDTIFNQVNEFAVVKGIQFVADVGGESEIRITIERSL